MSTRKVAFQHTIEYEVVNTSNLFHPQNWALLSVGKIEDARRFVVVDANVEKHHGAAIRAYFEYHHVDAPLFPAERKTRRSITTSLSRMNSISFPSIAATSRSLPSAAACLPIWWGSWRQVIVAECPTSKFRPH